jgi:hypothetical protein
MFVGFSKPDDEISNDFACSTCLREPRRTLLGDDERAWALAQRVCLLQRKRLRLRNQYTLDGCLRADLEMEKKWEQQRKLYEMVRDCSCACRATLH